MSTMYDLQILLKIFTEYLRGIKSTFEVDLRRDIYSRAARKIFSFKRGNFSLRAKHNFKGGLRNLDETMLQLFVSGS